MDEFKNIRIKTKLSFKYAIEGIKYAIRTQRNLRIHFIIAAVVLLLAFYLRCNLLEFAVIILTITLVICFELLNTAIEATIDLVSLINQPLAKIAKDLGAATVLCAAIGSIFIGIVILGPKLIEKFTLLMK
jgi:diacylglycerol kinase (ATP)